MWYVYIQFCIVRDDAKNADELEYCFRLFPGGKIWPWNKDAGEPHPIHEAQIEEAKRVKTVDDVQPQPTVVGAQTF
jgi:hypothetical protein